MKRTIVLALFFVAICSHAFAQNAVTACVKLENGQARVVSATTPCLPSETRVQWNVVGPAGPAGAPGPEGPIGPKGDPGPQGPGGAFRLLDSGDRLVGVVFTANILSSSSPSVLRVLRAIGDDIVAFDVTYAGYSGGATIYYTDATCSSADRYLLNNPEFFKFGTVTADAAGQRFLVYPGAQPAPEGLVLRSRRLSGSCLPQTVTVGAQSNYRLAEQQVLDLEFPFRLAQQ